MTKSLKLIGNITTKAPLQVSLPESNGSLPRNAQNIPYFPSSNIRGWIRHSTAECIAKIMKNANNALTVDDIYLIFSGVDTVENRIIEKDGTVIVGVNNEIRKNNPFLSLFGCWKFEGKLKVGNAYPTTEDNILVQVGSSSRGQVFERNNNAVDFIDPDQIERLSILLGEDAKISKEAEPFRNKIAELKKGYKTADKEERTAINSQIKELEAKISSIKDTREGSQNAIRQVLPSYEAIDEGVELAQRMSINNPTKDEVLMLIWGLYCCSLNPRLGGKGNVGCGEIHAHWDLMEYEFGSFTPKKIASVTIDDDGFKLESDIFTLADLESISERIKTKEINVKNYHEA